MFSIENFILFKNLQVASSRIVEYINQYHQTYLPMLHFTKPSLKLPEQKLCNRSLHRDSFDSKNTAMSAEEIQTQPSDECLISFSLLAIKQNQIHKYRDLIGIFGIEYNSKL